MTTVLFFMAFVLCVGFLSLYLAMYWINQTLERIVRAIEDHK